MKESDIEGVATHDGPESCDGAREGTGEALTGVHAGRPLSREISQLEAPTWLWDTEGNMVRSAIASAGTASRGRRTRACVESSCARTGRSTIYPPEMARRVASGRPEAVSR